jgi:hypothetical protein
MKTTVSSEADEINSMPDGMAQWSGRDIRWESRVDGHPGGCPMESGRVPVGGGQVLDGGRTGARWKAHGCPTEGGSRGVAQRRVLGVA